MKEAFINWGKVVIMLIGVLAFLFLMLILGNYTRLHKGSGCNGYDITCESTSF